MARTLCVCGVEIRLDALIAGFNKTTKHRDESRCGSLKAAPQATPDQPQDKARVEGILVNQVNGQPVRKAVISLRVSVIRPQPAGSSAPKSYSVMSDAAGKFVFEQVDPGGYTLTADRNGYLHAAYRSSGGTLLNVGPSQMVKNIRFVITPLGVIAGHVVDEDGDPITEVRVQAVRWSISNGVRRLESGQGAPVDDQGSFRISNLRAAHYLLMAQFSRKPASSSDNLTYVTTYYPSAPSKTQDEVLCFRGCARHVADRNVSTNSPQFIIIN